MVLGNDAQEILGIPANWKILDPEVTDDLDLFCRHIFIECCLVGLGGIEFYNFGGLVTTNAQEWVLAHRGHIFLKIVVVMVSGTK